MVKKYLIHLARSDIRFCLPIIRTYIESIERRFCDELDCSSALGERAAIATLSLPLFKNEWFPCISLEQQEHLLEVFDKLISRHLAPTQSGIVQPMEVDGFYDFSGGFSLASTSSINPPTSGRSMMSQYFNDKQKTPAMLKNFPPIERIFREYNTAPPSSGQVERLFSYATLMNAPRSNRLSDEKFEQRVILVNSTSLETYL